MTTTMKGLACMCSCSDKVLARRCRPGQFFEGAIPHWQCTVQRSIWDPYKNSWTDQDVVWDDEWVWPDEQCVTCMGVTIPERGGAILGETCPRSLKLRWIANWTGPCSGVHTVGRTLDCKRWTSLLSASKRVGGIAHCGRSLISTPCFFIIFGVYVGQGARFDIDCNKCTCHLGQVICTLRHCHSKHNSRMCLSTALRFFLVCICLLCNTVFVKIGVFLILLSCAIDQRRMTCTAQWWHQANSPTYRTIFKALAWGRTDYLAICFFSFDRKL